MQCLLLLHCKDGFSNTSECTLPVLFVKHVRAHNACPALIFLPSQRVYGFLGVIQDVRKFPLYLSEVGYFRVEATVNV